MVPLTIGPTMLSTRVYVRRAKFLKAMRDRFVDGLERCLMGRDPSGTRMYKFTRFGGLAVSLLLFEPPARPARLASVFLADFLSKP